MNSTANNKLPIWHIRVQWGPRKQALEQCVQATLQQFALVERHIGAVDWHQVSTRIVANNIPRTIDSSVVADALLVGRQKEEVEPFRVMEDLGFACWFTNAKMELDLKIHCGDYFERGGNDVDFSFDARGGRTLDIPGNLSLLKGMLELWDADFGAIYVQDKPVASTSETLVRYARPRRELHQGFPPIGRQIGQWRGGSVWAKDELSQHFSTWNLGAPRAFSVLGIAKFFLTYGRLPR